MLFMTTQSASDVIPPQTGSLICVTLVNGDVSSDVSSSEQKKAWREESRTKEKASSRRDGRVNIGVSLLVCVCG